jgi:hypothetical protein
VCIMSQLVIGTGTRAAQLASQPTNQWVVCQMSSLQQVQPSDLTAMPVPCWVPGYW